MGGLHGLLLLLLRWRWRLLWRLLRWRQKMLQPLQLGCYSQLSRFSCGRRGLRGWKCLLLQCSRGYLVHPCCSRMAGCRQPGSCRVQRRGLVGGYLWRCGTLCFLSGNC